MIPRRASRWSAGRRRTPTSLGCARRRNGARRAASWSARALSQSARRLPALHFPRPRGRRKRGKGRPGALNSKCPGSVSVGCLTSESDEPVVREGAARRLLAGGLRQVRRRLGAGGHGFRCRRRALGRRGSPCQGRRRFGRRGGLGGRRSGQPFDRRAHRVTGAAVADRIQQRRRRARALNAAQRIRQHDRVVPRSLHHERQLEPGHRPRSRRPRPTPGSRFP